MLSKKILSTILVVVVVGGLVVAGALTLASTPKTSAATTISAVSSSIMPTSSVLSSSVTTSSMASSEATSSAVNSTISSKTTSSKMNKAADDGVSAIKKATDEGVKRIEDATKKAVSQVDQAAGSTAKSSMPAPKQPTVTCANTQVIFFDKLGYKHAFGLSGCGGFDEANKCFKICYGVATWYPGTEKPKRYDVATFQAMGLIINDKNGKPLDYCSGGENTFKISYSTLSDISTLNFCLENQQIQVVVTP